jgi:hypothetical protein
MNSRMRLGIDFDNTMVTYDDIFRIVAPAFAKIDDGVGGQKREIRDYLRSLPDGERTWQRLQGYVYGKGISGANLFEGVGQFLYRCRSEACDVLIVSHKTEFGHHDPDRINLREAALGWMRAQGFFREGGYNIPEQNVFFESTRAEKLARIAALGCTHFIDDLEEILDDPQFPPNVSRILFSRSEMQPQTLRYPVCRTWNEIEMLVFHDRH